MATFPDEAVHPEGCAIEICGAAGVNGCGFTVATPASDVHHAASLINRL